MADDDIYDRLQRHLTQESNRGLGDIPLRATAALSPFSRAQLTAATNLLDKALRALDDGDEPRAHRFVERAVALPFDEHERVHPGAMMAHQKLFVAVTDALENGGEDWLAAATDTFASAPEEAKFSLRDVLSAVLQDYDLSDAERRRVRRLISDVPQRAELIDLDLQPEQMATAVFDVLEGIIHFADAYEESLERTHGEE
ncbi:MAG: hypothetical protein ABIQ61_02260 [Ornithinibacter sp.]